MSILLIFVWIWAAFIATSVWESSVEGRNAWDKGKKGWKFDILPKVRITTYHIFLFWIMIPMLLALPLIIYGWDIRLFGILLSAYFSGIVIEDFFWFVTNPVVKVSELNPQFASYYPWIKIGRFQIPKFYIIGMCLAIISYIIFWR